MKFLCAASATVCTLAVAGIVVAIMFGAIHLLDYLMSLPRPWGFVIWMAVLTSPFICLIFSFFYQHCRDKS